MGRARVGVVVTGVRRVRARAVMVLAVDSVAVAVLEALVVAGARDVAVARAGVVAATRAPWAPVSGSSPS
ncbi:hypothetical protein SAMN05443572_106441 [Myxococcus fulvus]|uniref:Uncharacterized protein n=1 Tax=Myxococcus fulvus TaxID=33 RepID=A0A511T1V4_MYXFU|nr:hypothetical protein MFU01_31720 [Myxococcus fulvus]SEU22739.1 hypothetical protein SAMN05443572_106441 [Myxococcus fulvus]